MERKKLITICHFGGDFENNKDDSLSYNGGEAHAIDVDHETPFEDFKSEIAELLHCTSSSVSIKYFLPGNRKTLINISNDKDFKRMVSFHGDSIMVDVYISTGETVAQDHCNLPVSGSSRTTLSEAVVPVDATPLDSDMEMMEVAITIHNDNIDDAPIDIPVDSALQMDMPVDSAPPIDIPIDSAPPALPLVKSEEEQPRALSSKMPPRRPKRATISSPVVLSDTLHHNVPKSWENSITGVNQRFPSAHEFREALQKYAIANGFAYTFKKNDRQRVTVRCKSETCPWRIHVSRLRTTDFYMIKKMNATHTCDGGVMTSGSRATANLVAGIVKEKLRDFPNYKPKDIINDIKRECGIELSYYQAWRGKDVAREKLMGSHKDAYTQLPLLCEKVKETNPGSFATFATKDDSKFQRLFIAFEASLHGFQLGCRPLIFLDSLLVKSKYQETFLFATAADGDDGVFPVAFAVVDDETADNWRWFLVELKSAISTSRSITFVADIEKGLRESIPEVFENGFHGYCIRYLSEIFRRELPTHHTPEVKRLLVADFFGTAYALKLDDFQRSTESMKGISPEAYSWIANSKPEHWANAFFMGARYNHMTANFGELFYSWVSETFELPITQKIHMLRAKMVELMDTRRELSSQWMTTLTPSMEEKLQKEIIKEESLNLEVLAPIGDWTYDVRGDSVQRVDIDQRTCSCKGWQISGLPCCHGIAVLKHIQRSPYDYCDTYLTTESYRLTYSKSINDVSDVDTPLQKDSSQVMVVVTPPTTRRQPGRPKQINRSVTKTLKQTEV